MLYSEYTSSRIVVGRTRKPFVVIDTDNKGIYNSTYYAIAATKSVKGINNDIK